MPSVAPTHLFQPVVYQRLEELPEHQGDADDQQRSANYPGGVNRAGSPSHDARRWCYGGWAAFKTNSDVISTVSVQSY